MFSNGAYATIWEVKDNGKFCDARISTSRKNADGNFEQDFSATVRFVGKAKDVVAGMKEKDRVHILNCGVSNQYNKEKKVLYTNYVVFECEDANGGKSAKPSAKAADTEPDTDGSMTEELPF